MEIKTKYNIGDEVYFMTDMKIYRATVDKIYTENQKFHGEIITKIKYDITVHNGFMNFIPSESPISEGLLFSSEQELKENIISIK